MSVRAAAAVAALCGLAGGALPARAHPALDAAVGKSCESCHPELVRPESFAHSKEIGCGDCHTVAVEGTTTAVALKANQPGLCIGCHREDAIRTSHRDLLTASTRCTACHDPHTTSRAEPLSGVRRHAPFAKGACDACHLARSGDRLRMKARGERLCLTCHVDPAEGAGNASVHRALGDDAEGRAGCLSCHDPHLGSRERLLRAADPGLCEGCHRATLDQARGRGGHPAAAASCLGCHRAHASKLPSLLAATPGALCAGCHDPAGAKLRQNHLDADLTKVDCHLCHAPHGSSRPDLLRTFVHQPLLEDCGNCHAGASTRLVEQDVNQLCRRCHEPVMARAASAAVKHEGFDDAPCTACHDPHAALGPKLVREPTQGCGACHDEMLPAAGEEAHGAIQRFGCQACHEAHGGSRPKLLRAEGAALCLACHGEEIERAPAASDLRVLDAISLTPLDRQRLSIVRLEADGEHGHPVTGHRTLGEPTPAEIRRGAADYRGALDCLVCHDPHKGKTKQHFRWGAASATEVCLHCHSK